MPTNYTTPQEIGTTTASNSSLDLPSTSLNVSSPQDLRPLPKIDRKRNRNMRKRKMYKSVLTSTPYKNYSEEEIQEKTKKK